ncbi:MAG: DUF167 domain-containing protein [Candidatus Moranbacteria bacterium]|nr:DUF167 domain-containing protein [Candidatus Moranbacteria bacterium]
MLSRKIFITAKTNAKKSSVEQIDETHFIVDVTATPVDGKANVAIAKALASFLGVAPLCITLIKGRTSKKKTFQYLA